MLLYDINHRRPCEGEGLGYIRHASGCVVLPLDCAVASLSLKGNIEPVVLYMVPSVFFFLRGCGCQPMAEGGKNQF